MCICTYIIPHLYAREFSDCQLTGQHIKVHYTPRSLQFVQIILLHEFVIGLFGSIPLCLRILKFIWCFHLKISMNYCCVNLELSCFAHVLFWHKQQAYSTYSIPLNSVHSVPKSMSRGIALTLTTSTCVIPI